MTVELLTFSTEYVFARVFSFPTGVTDPTGDAIEMAFTDSDTDAPAGGDWITAAWVTDASTRPTTYTAQVLTPSLTGGSYTVWLRIHHAPETIVRDVGSMIVRS